MKPFSRPICGNRVAVTLMRLASTTRAAAVLLLASALTLANPALAAPVLLISVDGMKPESILDADAHGLKIPYLRSLMAQGTYARGVVGVWPTVTYPSHTTLVTGVAPAEHGIFANLEFDPQRHFKESWFWYAAQVRVPTLWQVAHAKGITTASIAWPVTVGATGIDYLIPEYWRISGPTDELNPSDRHLIAALSLPTGLLAQMQSTLGPYLMANDLSPEADAIKTRFAIDILRKHRPGFMTLHLSSLDETEHANGPFSTEANTVLESIDTMLAQLAAAARAADPAAVVAVVSDHGFTALAQRVNLYIPFLKAGLIESGRDPDTNTPAVTAWTAQPWMAGGMAAIMLHDPRDAATERTVGHMLHSLAADPHNGIAAIIDRAHIKGLGGFPDAAFLVVLNPGYYTGANVSGNLITAIPGHHGGHGYSPEYPDMRASFFIAGVGIAPHRDLGLIGMRQIAPTLAHLLGVTLSSSQAAPLHLSQ